jgi:hypothetical protein
MYAHLTTGAPLPSSQVVKTTPRGSAANPLTGANVPPISATPGTDAITFDGTTLTIPELIGRVVVKSAACAGHFCHASPQRFPVILEVAPLQVRPGQAAAFEAALSEAQRIIASSRVVSHMNFTGA